MWVSFSVIPFSKLHTLHKVTVTAPPSKRGYFGHCSTSNCTKETLDWWVTLLRYDSMERNRSWWTANTASSGCVRSGSSIVHSQRESESSQPSEGRQQVAPQRPYLSDRQDGDTSPNPVTNFTSKLVTVPKPLNNCLRKIEQAHAEPRHKTSTVTRVGITQPSTFWSRISLLP
jgi:hypothetical protein